MKYYYDLIYFALLFSNQYLESKMIEFLNINYSKIRSKFKDI